MPDYTDLDREYLVSGTRMAQAAVAVTRKRGGEPFRAHDWVRDVLREAGAVPADLPNPMGMGAHDPVSDDAAVLEESITSGTPLRVDEDEAATIAACDPELNAMLTVAACLEGLSGYVVRKRVLDYITSRFVTEPPSSPPPDRPSLPRFPGRQGRAPKENT